MFSIGISYLRLTGGPLATNTYVVYSGTQGFIVDPGVEPKAIINAIRGLGIQEIAFIIATHGHFDHIFYAADLTSLYNVPLYIHRADLYALNRSSFLGSLLYKRMFKRPKLVRDITSEGDRVISGFQVKIIHTPGHTPGSICLIVGNFMFTGDTLFKGTVGRTDLPGGSKEDLKKSLMKILSLKGNYIILPGHGRETTLDEERASNPYLGLILTKELRKLQ